MCSRTVKGLPTETGGYRGGQGAVVKIPADSNSLPRRAPSASVECLPFSVFPALAKYQSCTRLEGEDEQWDVGGRGLGLKEAGGKTRGVHSVHNLELPSDSGTLESH